MTNFKTDGPRKGPDSCCYQCGVNHEARDLLRAVSIRIIDQLEQTRPFVELLWRHQFITKDAYDLALSETHEIESKFRLRRKFKEVSKQRLQQTFGS